MELLLNGKKNADMKKYIYLTIALPVLALASCQVEPIEEVIPENAVSSELVSKVFNADYDEEVDTKTILDGETTIKWTNGEEIVVFDDVTGMLPAFISSSAGASTTFSGSVSPTAKEYFALSPYQGDATIASNVITATIPQVQYAVEGGFDPRACLAVAYTTPGTDELNFKLAVSFLKVTIPDDDVVAVELSASGSEASNMTGSVSLTVKKDGTNPSIANGTGDCFKSVVLRNEDFSSLTKDATYYIAVRPTGTKTYTNFTARVFKNGDKVGTLVSGNYLAVSRKNVKTVPFPSIGTYDVDRYTCYEFGLPVIIGDKTFRKSVLGASRKITPKTLNNTTVNVEGVTFLAGGEYPYSTEIALSEDIIMIGNDDTAAKLVGAGGDGNSKAWKLMSGSLSLNSLVLDISAYTKNGFACNKDATSDYSSFEINGCHIVGGYPVFFQNSSKYDNSIAEIRIVNSIYSTARDTQIINIPNATNSQNFTSIVFNNNTVYSRTSTSTFNCDVLNGKTSGVTESTTTSISMNKNLFVNTVSSGGSLKFFDVTSLSIVKNVFWDGNSYNMGGSSSAKLVVLQNTNPSNLASFNLGDNIGIGLADGKAYRYSSGTLATNIKNQFSLQDLLNDNPFSSNPVVNVDGSIGDVNWLPAYSDIGPQINVPM